MSLQERKAIFSIVTSILILGGYVYYTFGLHGETNLPQINDLQFWAKFMLTMMVVTIVLKIVAHILYAIIHSIRNKEEELDFMDDYDKQIEIRSDRNGNYIFMLGFIASMIPIAMGKPVYYMFLILLISGFVGGIAGDLWKIYYYRKGL